jgi:hypothetical protein
MDKFASTWSTPNPFLQKQFNRRILVILNIALIVISLIFIVLNFKIIAAITSLIAFIIAPILIISIRNSSNAYDSFADERERKLRDHAHRIAYWIIVSLLILPINYLGRVVGAKFIDENMKIILDLTHISVFTIINLIVIFTVLISTLPTWIVAWLEPSPPED